VRLALIVTLLILPATRGILKRMVFWLFAFLGTVFLGSR